MTRRRSAVAMLLGLVLAACGAQPAARSDPPLPTEAATALATPATTPGSSITAATPTAPPASMPTPPQLPEPPKPTGVAVDIRYEGYCPPDDPESLCSIDERIVTVSWKKPRTKGVQIRVFGVTECFAADGSGNVIDGYCLRRDTALPPAVRVLLAKVAASKGTVTLRLAAGPALGETHDGAAIYSIVLAAYNADGEHSIFAIAETAEYCLVAEVPCNDEEG